jgi:hypothetical protein
MSLTKTTGPSRALVIGAQIVGALIGGVIVAVAFGYGIGLLLLGSGLGMGLLSLQVFAAVLGFGVGAGAGVAAAGRLLGQSGRTWLAIGGGVLTGIVVILGMRLLNVGGLGGILAVAVALVLAVSILGYNLRRP